MLGNVHWAVLHNYRTQTKAPESVVLTGAKNDLTERPRSKAFDIANPDDVNVRIN